MPGEYQGTVYVPAAPGGILCTVQVKNRLM